MGTQLQPLINYKLLCLMKRNEIYKNNENYKYKIKTNKIDFQSDICKYIRKIMTKRSKKINEKLKKSNYKRYLEGNEKIKKMNTENENNYLTREHSRNWLKKI